MSIPSCIEKTNIFLIRRFEKKEEYYIHKFNLRVYGRKIYS